MLRSGLQLSLKLGYHTLKRRSGLGALQSVNKPAAGCPVELEYAGRVWRPREPEREEITSTARVEVAWSLMLRLVFVRLVSDTQQRWSE